MQSCAISAYPSTFFVLFAEQASEHVAQVRSEAMTVTETASGGDLFLVTDAASERRQAPVTIWPGPPQTTCVNCVIAGPVVLR
jgi:hypothetical protein